MTTNVLLMTLYSMNNTPYSAMSGVMTASSDERTVLSSYRFVAAMLAQLVVGGFTLPLVAKFGHGDNAKGWQTTMTLWAVICVVCFVITFLTTRERIQPPPQQKVEAKVDFKNLLKNGPWIAMFVLTFSPLHLRGDARQDDVLLLPVLRRSDAAARVPATGRPAAGDRPRLPDGGHSLMNTFGLILNADRSNVASVGFSLFNIASRGVTVIGVACSTWLAMRFGKRAVALVGFHDGDRLHGVVHLPAVRRRSEATYGLELVRALCYAPTIPLIWAMCSLMSPTSPSGRPGVGRRGWCSRRFSSR